MNLWEQLPKATKIYLAVFICLIVFLVGLVVLRWTNNSFQDTTIWRVVFHRVIDQKITQSPDLQLIAPTATFPPSTPLLYPAEDIPVFGGPGDQYSVIAILEKSRNAKIVGISQNGKWWAIDLPYFVDGRGWVAAKKVQAENTSNVRVVDQEISTPAGTTPTGSGATVLAIANVNVRSGPDIKYMKIGNIQKGQSVDVLGVSEDNNWWLIRLPDTKAVQGWISRDYVVGRNTDNVPIIGSTIGLEQTISPGSPYLIANLVVNVRVGPGITYAIIGQLNQGQLAEIVGVTRDGIWWQIKYPSAEEGLGYVAAAYVKAENTGNVPVVR
jgi:uncharacterized protein YraI